MPIWGSVMTEFWRGFGAGLSTFLFALTPSIGAAQSRDLVPLAFNVFEVCARAGFAGSVMSERHVFETALAATEVQDAKSLTMAEIFVDRGPNFGCDVKVSATGFDPEVFFKMADRFRADGMSGVISNCKWGQIANPKASILNCLYAPVTHPDGAQYSFSSDFVLLVDGPVLMMFYPTLKIDSNGNAELVGR